MSVAENIILPSYKQLSKYGFINRAKTLEISKHFVDLFNVKTASLNNPISNLSGGNQQKAIIARWIARNVKMLILDEPTRGIDVNAKSEVHRIIKELADEGVSIILISSEMEEILSLSDRILVIRSGELGAIVENHENVSQKEILKVAFNHEEN